MRPARQIIDLGRTSRSELSAANNAKKRDSFFQEVSFEYIIHNAQEKLFVARHQASEARSVLKYVSTERTQVTTPQAILTSITR